MTTKITFNNIADSTLATLKGPKVTKVDYPGTGSATDIAGGETINLTGAGFQSGCSVLVASTAASVVTFINGTQVSFIAPPLAAGTYVIYVINPDGGTAISIPGISYSGVPNWTTSAGTLGNVYEQGDINSTFVATGDNPVTYTLYSGTLPPGSTLNSSTGFLSGTAPASSGATTYSFVIRATDAQNQVTNRSFSLTVDTDIVTWANPTLNSTINLVQDTTIEDITLSATSAAGASVSYSADSLPTGLTLSSGVISGTPTVSANTSTVLTATASTTRLANNSINWVVVLGGDIYFNSTTLLLPGNATTFVKDASTNNFPVTIVGDTKPNNFNPYLNNYSNFFDGTGDYLTTPSNAALALGTSDFTVECWVNATSTPSDIGIFESRTDGNAATENGFTLTAFSSSVIRIYSNGILISSSGTTYINTWCHVAVVRASGVWTLYVNGVSQGTSSAVRNMTNTDTVIGAGRYNANSTPSAFFPGYISNLRIVKGIAVYTANFTPPTQPLTAIAGTSLLTCQSNRIIDTSTNNFAIARTGDVAVRSFSPFIESASTNGSGYFDGTGDYLTVAPDAQTYLSSDPFTMEAWVYPIATTGLIAGRRAAVAARGFLIGFSSDSKMRFWAGDTDFTAWNVQLNSTNAYTSNQWYHVAATRDSSNVFNLWVNGVSVANATASFAIADDTSTLQIGTVDSGNSPFSGYITGFRLVKGTAVYTTAFTPPTAPLTAVSGTSLLTLQNNTPVNNNTFLDSSSVNGLITRSGNTTQGSFSPYSPSGWSNYFDGTGDALSSPTTGDLFNFGTGDFCVEAFVNFNTLSEQYVVGTYDGGNGGWAMYIPTGSSISFRNGDASQVSRTFSFVAGTWYHVAVSRSSSTLRFFVNGTQVGADQASYTQNISRNNTNGCAIGRYMLSDNQNGGYLTGYISNLRVVKGAATYTTNFTPSTTPLTAIAGTSLLTCADNRIVDDSANNFAITKTGDARITNFSPFKAVVQTPQTYSAYFDGSTAKLTLPASALMSLTGEFTIECWVYWAGTSTNYQNFIGSNDTFSSNASFFRVWGAGFATLGSKIGIGNPTHDGTAAVYSNTSLTPNTWYHVAATRDSSNVIRVFINGTLEKTGSTDSTTYNFGQGGTCIGQAPWDGAQGWYTGQISNLHVIKGSCLYTTSFTPSTAPLTAVAGTSLLTCQSATFVDNSTNKFAITAVGNSKPTTVNPFGSTFANSTGYTAAEYSGSTYFDGNGDWLALGTLPGLGSGNWTVEFWHYFAVSTLPTNATVFDMRGGTNGVGVTQPVIELTSTNGFVWYVNAANAITSTPAAVKLQSWQHVAIVKNSGSTKMYLDGVQVGTTYTDSKNYPAGSTYLGRANDGSSTRYYTGNISDLRVVTGTALYTSNFVPPLAPVQPVQNTVLLLNGTSAAITDATTKTVLETVGDAKISTVQSKFGGSSMYFDGTGDYLQLRGDEPIGTGDFTIEGWFWLGGIADTYYNIFQSGVFGIRYANNGFANRLQISHDMNTVGSIYSCVIQSGNNAYVWAHICWTRSSGTNRLFFNGTQQNLGTGINPATYPVSSFSNSGNVAAAGSIGSSWLGYMQDFRITKGLARYTANFTPPTSALLTK